MTSSNPVTKKVYFPSGPVVENSSLVGELKFHGQLTLHTTTIEPSYSRIHALQHDKAANLNRESMQCSEEPAQPK